MDSSEYQTLMGIAVLERARAIAAAEQRFADRVKAIREVRELAVLKKESEPPAEPLKRGDVVTRVRIAVAGMPEVFMLRDLVKAVRGQDEAGTQITAKAISSAVKRFVGRHVEVVEKGIGKRGSKYKKLSLEPATAEKGEQ